jgi:hypothetical protein
MNMTIHVFGKDELVAKFKRIVDTMPQMLGQTMNIQMIRLADYVRASKLSGNPLHRRSGTLSRAVHGSSKVDGTTVIGSVGVTGVPYAVIWEKTGSKAHDVFPVEKKALHFVINGKDIFAMKVHIPAQAPRPFLKPSLDEKRADIVAAIRATAVGMFRAT